MIRLQLLDRADIARAMTLMAIERAAAQKPVGLVKRGATSCVKLAPKPAAAPARAVASIAGMKTRSQQTTNTERKLADRARRDRGDDDRARSGSRVRPPATWRARAAARARAGGFQILALAADRQIVGPSRVAENGGPHGAAAGGSQAQPWSTRGARAGDQSPKLAV